MNDNITEINKDTFWALIQEAKDTCGQDTDAWAKYMIDRLAGLGPDQSLMFLNYMDAYKDLSFRYGLWDAAKIFRVDGCSDDSFSYFRSWLIVQGKDVYMAALADPDSLADVEPYADCFFETAGYVGAYVNLCLAISAQAIAQRSTVMRKTHSDNELFTFRVWLVRLGLNGDEFKNTRNHLLANLEGDRAYRYDKDTYEANKKKKKSRERER